MSSPTRRTENSVPSTTTRLEPTFTTKGRCVSRATSKNASPRLRSTLRAVSVTSTRTKLSVFRVIFEPSFIGTEATPPTGVR
jgi:hypothetical protein